jgi:hypothetical protein
MKIAVKTRKSYSVFLGYQRRGRTSDTRFVPGGVLPWALAIRYGTMAPVLVHKS